MRFGAFYFFLLVISARTWSTFESGDFFSILDSVLTRLSVFGHVNSMDCSDVLVRDSKLTGYLT